CLLYLPRLGTAALWEPDEGRYAEIAREMLVSGDYVTQRDDWVRYFEKPPLVYWTTAAAIRLLGHSEGAVRLPIALASIAQIALTEVLAESMLGAAGGVCAAIGLGLSPLFFGFSRFLTLDPMLAMFVTAALASFYAATRKPALRAGRNWLYLGALFGALGTLTKGPVALILTGATGLIFLLIEGRGSELAEVPWLGCGLIVATVNLPWFTAVSWRNPGFLRFFFIHEHLQRYAVSNEHQWGPYFFVVVIAVGLWPWICFVPIRIREMFRPVPDRWIGAAARIPVAAFEVRREDQTPAVNRDEVRRGLRFALIWFAVVLVFFSIPRSKLGSYILPGMPAAAILAGYGISRLPRIYPRRVSRILAMIAAIDLFVAAAAIIAAPRIRELHVIPALRTDLMVGVCAMTLGATAAFALWRIAAGPLPALAIIALGMIVGLGTMVKAREDAASLNSYRQLASAIARELRPGCVMASYHHHVQALPFYTGWREALVGYRGELAPWGSAADAAPSFIATDDELRARWSSGSCVILVINRRDFSGLGPTLNPPPRQIAVEGKKLAITNLPGGG
ncbi:MAG TPA: glycosyltransferase family 39 protein, partial [Candidatus Binataceae bacterium]